MPVDIATHITETWGRLRRNALDVAFDAKVDSDRRSYLYIPQEENIDAINAMIRERRRQTGENYPVEIRHLDENVATPDHGVLYLPNDYIVPGGRFNEMYYWDSYWITLGLLRDGMIDLAKGMVENCLYQIEHYGGKVLNANRTYYISRSQPPVLGQMVLAVAPHLDPALRSKFIARALAAMTRNYREFWVTQRRTERTGLFHYGNLNQGALGLCPEVEFGERHPGTGESHYDKIIAHLSALPPQDALRHRFYDPAANSLTYEAIAGDRAMRESGFDASMHMGYYGLETLDYNPICLNTLLYGQCRIMAQLHSVAGDGDEAAYFRNEANAIAAAIHRYCWNPGTGLFADYNHRLDQISDFKFLSAAYPIAVGIASPAQAAAFRDNLPEFETPYGLKSAICQTGCQWNAPFMWAPLVYYTAEGLNTYGYADDAKRIARKFLKTVTDIFAHTNDIYEKYNADDGGKDTGQIIEAGYAENVRGFGWTNGVVSELTHWLAGGDHGRYIAPWRNLMENADVTARSDF